MSKYLSPKYVLISKTINSLIQAIQKILFGGGVILVGDYKGLDPQSMSKYLSLKYLVISITISSLAKKKLKKQIFMGPILGGSRRVAQKFQETKLRL